MTATVCVDAGTTLVKAVVFDAVGRELVVVRRPATVLTPRPGWSEQDMDAVLTAVGACVAEAVSRSPVPVGRVALTGQGDGAWLVSADGRPVRAAVSWNDARSRDIVDGWQRNGVLDAAFRLTGGVGNLGLPHAILAWFAEHDPGVLAAAAGSFTCGSWIFGSLTGTWGLHRSEASAPWLDVGTGTVSEEAVDLFGLRPWRHLVPTVLEPDQLTAPLIPAAADRLGLPAGVPVTLAPYDVVATAVGGGSLRPGDGFCILGTTLCTGSVIANASVDTLPGGLTLLADPGGPLIRAFPTLAGTGVLTWLAGLLGRTDVPAVLDLAAGAPAGAHGVRVWPYLSPGGERAPFLDSSARGVVAGLTLHTGPADLARAVLEALAHVIRECVESVGTPPGRLRTSGGGSAGDLWCQTVADVSGLVVERAGGSEVGARGGLMYASVAAGEHPDLAAAAHHLVPSPEVFAPDAEHRWLHDLRHRELLAARPALAGLWRTWADHDLTTDGGPASPTRSSPPH